MSPETVSDQQCAPGCNREYPHLGACISRPTPSSPDPLTPQGALVLELERAANGGTDRVEVTPGLLRHAALWINHAALPSAPDHRLRPALKAWWTDDPWEKGNHEFDAEGDFFCYGCGAKAPFAFDHEQPEWWTQQPDPLVGHNDPCPWTLTRAVLSEATPDPAFDVDVLEKAFVHVIDRRPTKVEVTYFYGGTIPVEHQRAAFLRDVIAEYTRLSASQPPEPDIQ